VTTLAAGWRDARAGDPDFDRVQWNRRIEVDTTTLDRLIEQFESRRSSKSTSKQRARRPRRPWASMPALSFEYLPRAPRKFSVPGPAHHARAVSVQLVGW
jgi:hypothetical protein